MDIAFVINEQFRRLDALLRDGYITEQDYEEHCIQIYDVLRSVCTTEDATQIGEEIDSLDPVGEQDYEGQVEAEVEKPF